MLLLRRGFLAQYSNDADGLAKLQRGKEFKLEIREDALEKAMFVTAKDEGRVESTQHDGQNEGVDREMSSNQQGGGKVGHLFRVDFFDQPGRAGTFPRVMN